MTTPHPPQLAAILAAFGLGRALDVQPLGGTAARKWNVLTERGRFVVRRRPDELADAASVGFDHAVLRRLEAAGFPVALIFEIGAQNSLGGAAQGTIDGTRCVAQMQALGARPNSGVFLTSDTDVASVQDIETTEDYWAAADVPIFAAGFRIGGYADGTELMALHSKGLNFEWAAGAASWDGTRDFEATGNPDIVQGIISAGGTWAGIKWPVIAGLNYDPNVIYSADVGQL